MHTDKFFDGDQKYNIHYNSDMSGEIEINKVGVSEMTIPFSTIQEFVELHNDKQISDELADMQPCPVCGGRCAWAKCIGNKIIGTFDKQHLHYAPYSCENGCVQSDGQVSQTRSEWLALDRSKMPTPKKTERWYQVKQALIITPNLGYGEDTMQYCDEFAVAAENMEAARSMFSLKDKPTPVADCNPEVVISDPITAPNWYKWHPVAECRDITAFFPFHLGNAIKYIWRAGKKVDTLTDLMKAKEEIDNQIRANLIKQKKAKEVGND